MKVLVSGAAGRMGKEVIKGILKAGDIELVGAVDIRQIGCDVGLLVGNNKIGLVVEEELHSALKVKKPEVVVDFSTPKTVLPNARIVIENKVHVIIGTTGLTTKDLDELHVLCEKHGVAALVAPNFALGAVLMMQFARQAARYFPEAEIVELHHDQKLDAPSGTSLKTAEGMVHARKQLHPKEDASFEKIAGSRGGEYQGVRIHSVRLPGLIAHQEVLFGGPGEFLTIRHDSTTRESFIPGVLLAIRKIQCVKGVLYGLENLLDD